MKEIVSLIVTHENRLRCIMKEFIGSANHYMNCCVLKLVMEKRLGKINYDLSMVYDGETHKTGKYYISKQGVDTEKRLSFPHIVYTVDKLLNVKVDKLKSGVKYIFYIIRHAQSLHNLYNFMEKMISPLKLDTSITDIGIKQCENAGKFLNKYLGGIKIDYLFCSDLKRTRQTMSVICSKLNNKKPNKFIVIPCSHEVHYSKSGNCDKSMIRSIRSIAGENRTVCNIKSDDEQCYEATYKSKNYDIDWSFYNKFYGNDGRQFVYLKDSKYTCSRNDFIELMMKYINLY
jgi:bisphosphoglycerate-dependent phosphoglycerate mutase